MDKNSQNTLFNVVITEHKGIFFKVAKTYCKDEDDRKDLLQEMMIQVWQSLPKYKSEFKQSTWLYRVVMNVAISNFRKFSSRRKHYQEIDFDITDFEEVNTPEENPNLQVLEQFIANLNEFDKALMILYLEDKSHAEISDILGISTSNVSTKIQRIKEKLKQKLFK